MDKQNDNQYQYPCHQNNYYLQIQQQTDEQEQQSLIQTCGAVAWILQKIVENNDKKLQQCELNNFINQQQIILNNNKIFKVFELELNTKTTFDLLATILQQFTQKIHLKKELLVAVVIYLDKVSQQSGIIINSKNVYLLLCTSIIIAQKMYSDIFYQLQSYAMLMQVDTKMLQRSESTFLKMIQYNLLINTYEYNEYREFICRKFSDTNLQEQYNYSTFSSLMTSIDLTQCQSFTEAGQIIKNSFNKE